MISVYSTSALLTMPLDNIFVVKSALLSTMIGNPTSRVNSGKGAIVVATPRNRKVLRQRQWTDQQLLKAGFGYYAPIKRIVMARMLAEHANIDVTLEVLIADKGDILLYTPSDVLHDDLDDYDHWPVRSDLFRQTYARWDDMTWQPTPTEKFLMQNGCIPYYRKRGVWALKLPISIYVQSLESPEPVIVPAGRWLAIGPEGEPYNMSHESFLERYQTEPSSV